MMGKHHKNPAVDPLLLVSCPQCQKEVRQKCLKDHLKIHQEKEIFICEICPRSFTNKGSYRNHVYALHSGPVRTFPCKECGTILCSKASLKQHEETHSSSKKKIPCHLCSNSVSLPNYNSHVKRCSGQKDFLCYFCQKGFSDFSSLASHVTGLHLKETPHSCKKCRYRTTHVGNLRKHENQRHSKKRSYKCYFCGFQCLNRQSASNHIAAKHIKERSFRCDYCPKRYSLPSGLRDHMKIGGRTKEDKRKHGLFHTKVPCPKCFKIVERGTLARHLKGHDSIPTVYKCPICSKVFRSRQGWRLHIKNHDVNTKGTIFKCEKCGKNYSNGSNLLRHKKEHLRNKKMTCPLCGVHVLPQCYNGHLRDMHGPRRYICYFCGYGFSNFTNLSAHMLSQHAKERPWKCDHCPNFRSCQASTLRYHKKKHHVS